MERDLRDKVAIITGGAQGLGLAIAHAFLQNGVKIVVILDIDEKLASTTAADLNTTYGPNKANYFKCDVTRDLENVFQSVVNKYKTIDILVNNAGTVDELDPRKVIDINVTALIEWSYKFWEHMRKDKGGKGGTIINLSSLAGCGTDQFLTVYRTSKFAVNAFTKSLGHRYHFERSGVRVYAICPGMTHTGLLDKMRVANEEKVKEDFEEYAKGLKYQEPEAVGRAVVQTFAAADSGTAWLIDGNEPITEV